MSAIPNLQTGRPARAEFAAESFTAADYAKLKVVPARHPWRIAGALFSILVIGSIARSILSNPRWEWNVFAEWFFSEPILVGLGHTLLLTAFGILIGAALGLVLALARISSSPLLSALSAGYVWLFRSVPILVLLLVINNLGYLYDTLQIGIPFTDVVLYSAPTMQVISPFAAALIGLSLNQAAFSAELFRGGILSVDRGQHEAAAALGLSRARQMFRIILPQALRTILPGTFNDIIGLAKATANAYILALPELFYTVMVIYRRNFEVIPLLMVATAWYLVILAVLSVAQRHVERYFSKGLLPRRGRAKRPSAHHVAVTDGAAAAAEPNVRGGRIAIHAASKRYGAITALDQVSIDLPAGSVTAIIGPSGSGKSTLLRAINHLERLESGVITIDGGLIGYQHVGDVLRELPEREILAQRADVGMVFQSFNLFPHLTVLENLTEGPRQVRGLSREEAQARARRLLARVGLADRADAYPRELSGGQQQRVAIARAMALRPKVLLFDEPTSALDPELVGEVLTAIREIAHQGTTLVIVTHELSFARDVADLVVFMENGRVIETGTARSVLSQPRHERTAAFVRSLAAESTPATPAGG